MQYLFRYSTNPNKNRVLVAIAESKQKASWQKLNSATAFLLLLAPPNQIIAKKNYVFFNFIYL